MVYTQGPERRITASSMLITHVDRVRLMRLALEKLELVDVGICLSRATARELIAFSAPAGKLSYAVPGSDMIAQPRRTVLAIQSRVYDDGRKREDLLIKLAQAMRLDWFHFDIVGPGWEPIIPVLVGAGATVDYFRGGTDFEAEYQVALERLSRADYYLYLGLDEGSMGVLDALSAGVATIVTKQGFHLDLDHGITHGFLEFDELLAIFQQLASERAQRRAGVDAYNWNEYARRHAVIWRAILSGGVTDYFRLFDDEVVNGEQARRLRVAARWAELALAQGRRKAQSVLARARRLLDRD
jgi:hypothetical protein